MSVRSAEQIGAAEGQAYVHTRRARRAKRQAPRCPLSLRAVAAKKVVRQNDLLVSGGGRGIRTLVTWITGKTVFETAAFNHSAIPPYSVRCTIRKRRQMRAYKKSPVNLGGRSKQMAERWGFEPQIRFWRIHDFQSCSFGQLGHLSAST